MRRAISQNIQRLDVDEIEIAAKPDDEKLWLVHQASDKLAAEDAAFAISSSWEMADPRWRQCAERRSW